MLADEERAHSRAHTGGGMPELLLKSPASAPQDYCCQQNCTGNRTYYDIGTTGTCRSEGVELKKRGTKDAAHESAEDKTRGIDFNNLFFVFF